MASSFQIPLHFEDLLRRAAGDWRVSEQRGARTDDLLELASADFASILNSTAPPSDAFSALYNAIWRFSKSNQSERKSTVKGAIGLSVTASASNATQTKIALFFLCGLTANAEALTTSCKYWDKSGREAVLEAAHALVSQIASPPPFPDVDREKLAGLLQRASLGVLQSTTGARDRSARVVVARLLGAALQLDTNQHVAASSALIHALHRHEHIAQPIAEVVQTLMDECDMGTFCGELVREMASLDVDALARDAVASKSVSTCISAIAERKHEVIKGNLAGLLAHLDGPSYMMRNGIVHAIGILIRESPRANDPLLDTLSERAMKDANAFTRSKAMQTWAALAQAAVIPVRFFPLVSAVAASRLDDKGAVVRKAAAQLLGTLLRTNPFGPQLKLSHFEAKLEQERKAAEERKKAEEETVAAEAIEAGEKEKNDAMEDDENADFEVPDVTVDNIDDIPPEKEDEDARRLKYYESAVSYIKSVEEGLSKVYGLLRSKSITDVSEAVTLLVTAIQFQLDAASGRAVRAMLPLALAREPNIRTAAVKAYVSLLSPGGDGVDEKDSAMGVTNGLIALAVGATMGELACLEALVSALSAPSKDANSIITEAVITVTWDIFAGKVPGARTEQRIAACMLIGMFTPSHPESLRSRVQILEEIGLNEPVYARWACAALCKLPEGSDSSMRVSHRLIELCKNTTDLAVIDQAITAIFRLHPSPSQDVSTLVRELAVSIAGKGDRVPISELSRFLVLVGQVAIKQLVRVESMVAALRRNTLKQDRKDDNEDVERELADADKMLEHAEKELVAPRSLLGRWGTLAARISADENACCKLRASAVLCMTKLMCVQADYCDTNLQLLFTILERASHSHVRSNAVTALGDLAFRFPNLVEPWSTRIYAALRDEHTQVRTNTLMALTHLILNDMVKVKGQIVEIAVCLLDDERRIADLARIFFHELARKSANAIYNILPDTISCLSRRVGSAQFKEVIGFLIGLLDKDKHAEGMIDKLCHRFRVIEGEQESRDLAYCISLLNVSERGLKKLNDNFKSFAPALVDDAVYKSFTTVLAKARKNCTSANAVQVLEEVTVKIENQRKSGVDDGGDTESVTVETKRVPRRASVAARKSISEGRRKSTRKSSITTTTTTTATSEKKKTNRRRKIEDDSESETSVDLPDSESGEEDVSMSDGSE